MFRKFTDDDEIERINKLTKAWLNKNYDLMDNQNDFPEYSFHLRPNNLHATSFDVLKNNNVRINIDYEYYFSRWVNDHKRMGDNRIVRGSLLCGAVKNITEVKYSRLSEIKINFFSKVKNITFPVDGIKSISVMCKKIYIENIEIYAEYNNELIPAKEYDEIIWRREHK